MREYRICGNCGKACEDTDFCSPRCERKYTKVMNATYTPKPGEPSDEELDARMAKYLEEHADQSEPKHHTTIRDPWERAPRSQKQNGRRYTDSGTEGY